MENKIPKLHACKAACEPQDKDFWVRYRELGGTPKWERPDWAVALRVMSSLEDDLELEPRPANHKSKQQKAMRRVRRMLELCVGENTTKNVPVRKKFALAEVWVNQA